MQETIDYLKTFYNLAKKKSLEEALKFDWQTTQNDLDELVEKFTLASLSAVFLIPATVAVAYVVYENYKHKHTTS